MSAKEKKNPENKAPVQQAPDQLSNEDAHVIAFCHQITTGLSSIGSTVESTIAQLHNSIKQLRVENDRLKKENDKLNVELGLLTKKKK